MCTEMLTENRYGLQAGQSGTRLLLQNHNYVICLLFVLNPHQCLRYTDPFPQTVPEA